MVIFAKLINTFLKIIDWAGMTYHNGDQDYVAMVHEPKNLS